MKLTGLYPKLKAATGRSRSTGLAGGLLLTQTVKVCGLDQGLSAALSPWRAVTVWLMPRWCAPNRAGTAWLSPTRPCRVCSRC